MGSANGCFTTVTRAQHKKDTDQCCGTAWRHIGSGPLSTEDDKGIRTVSQLPCRRIRSDERRYCPSQEESKQFLKA